MSSFPFRISSNPHYIHVFEFEKYDHERLRVWLKEEGNWSLVIYPTVLYILGITLGQKYMENKKPIQLKQYLILWNIVQAVISAIVFIRMVPELYAQWSAKSLHTTFCTLENFHNYATSFWGVFFCFSKLLDFGDTAFLILAKKPVLFLHWYHHVTVAVYCLFVADSSDPATRWFAVINSGVHFIMYTYYALSAMRIRIPRTLTMCITSLQLAQMVFGVYINLSTYRMIINNTQCNRPMVTIYSSLAIYASYFVLFTKFFISAYIIPKHKTKPRSS